MSNRKYTQFFYTPHAKPVLIDCNFVVDAANGNGLGIRSLKGPSVQNVFMHTSAAFTGTSHTSTLIDGIASGTSSLKVGMPVQGSGIIAGSTIATIVDSGSITLSVATSSSTTGSITYQAVGNPNPASGMILVQFQDNFNRYFGGFSGQVSPLSGSTVTSTTANVSYTIVSLGTATLAQWQTAGLPVGMQPQVGSSFVALVTGTIGGSGAVQAIATAGSNIDHIEIFGDPNATINPSIVYNPLGQATYGQILMACFKANALTAPADNTTIGLSFYFSNSTVSFGSAG